MWGTFPTHDRVTSQFSEKTSDTTPFTTTLTFYHYSVLLHSFQDPTNHLFRTDSPTQKTNVVSSTLVCRMSFDQSYTYFGVSVTLPTFPNKWVYFSESHLSFRLWARLDFAELFSFFLHRTKTQRQSPTPGPFPGVHTNPDIPSCKGDMDTPHLHGQKNNRTGLLTLNFDRNQFVFFFTSSWGTRLLRTINSGFLLSWSPSRRVCFPYVRFRVPPLSGTYKLLVFLRSHHP